VFAMRMRDIQRGAIRTFIVPQCRADRGRGPAPFPPSTRTSSLLFGVLDSFRSLGAIDRGADGPESDPAARQSSFLSMGPLIRGRRKNPHFRHLTSLGWERRSRRCSDCDRRAHVLHPDMLWTVQAAGLSVRGRLPPEVAPAGIADAARCGLEQ
jgi:hypothetical protein